MGLDQYAYIASKAGEEWDNHQEISYWRKHPNLQGWMERLWEEKGRPGLFGVGQDKEYDVSFNGIEVELTWEDIEQLEQDIESGAMAALGTVGFFFGEASDDYYREKDLEFCRNARAELFLKRRVFYNSSW